MPDNEQSFEPPSAGELETSKPKVKSDILIIQAWRDGKFSESKQRELAARREKETKERLEDVQAGINALKSLGFDPDHIVVEFDYSRIAHNHALLDQQEGYYNKQIVRRQTTLSELPGIIAECDENFRQHSLWPDGVIPFTFARLHLSPPITEANKEEIWKKEVKTKGEWKIYLEKFFSAIDVFITVHSSATGNFADFDWQEICRVGQKEDPEGIRLRLVNFSERTLPLHDYARDERFWTGEAAFGPGVIHVTTVSSPAPEPPTVFGVDRDITDQVAFSDASYFEVSFLDEMTDGKSTNRARAFAAAAYEAQTPADAREYIKKYFASCFKFYPELNERLEAVLPDSEIDVAKKMEAILKKLFEGIVF